MTSSRHVLIAGPAAAELDTLADRLRTRGVLVSDASPHHPEPVTFLLLAENLDADLDWDGWWDADSVNRRLFEETLPRLAPSAHGLLVAFSRRDDPAARAQVRYGMSSLVRLFHSHAAAERGVSFSMNGLEVPPGSDRDLLTRRLDEFASRRSVLADEVIIRLDHLTRQSVIDAVTTDII